MMGCVQEIKTHTEKVQSGELVRYQEFCPHCAGQGPFRLHDRRRRQFRVVEEGVVHVLDSWICRWRCLSCRSRFSDYPPLPCRRSVL